MLSDFQSSCWKTTTSPIYYYVCVPWKIAIPLPVQFQVNWLFWFFRIISISASHSSRWRFWCFIHPESHYLYKLFQTWAYICRQVKTKPNRFFWMLAGFSFSEYRAGLNSAILQLNFGEKEREKGDTRRLKNLEMEKIVVRRKRSRSSWDFGSFSISCFFNFLFWKRVYYYCTPVKLASTKYTEIETGFAATWNAFLEWGEGMNQSATMTMHVGHYYHYWRLCFGL